MSSVGAPTIALKTAQPIGGAPSLPKATVQLQPPTQPLGSIGSSQSQMATLQMDDEEGASANSGLLKALSIVGFVAACVVMYFQVTTAQIWVDAPDREAMKGDFQLLLDPSANADCLPPAPDTDSKAKP